MGKGTGGWFWLSNRGLTRNLGAQGIGAKPESGGAVQRYQAPSPPAVWTELPDTLLFSGPS